MDIINLYEFLSLRYRASVQFYFYTHASDSSGFFMATDRQILEYHDKKNYDVKLPKRVLHAGGKPDPTSYHGLCRVWPCTLEGNNLDEHCGNYSKIII